MNLLPTIVLWIIGILGIFFILALGIGWLMSAPAYKGDISDHFDGTRFVNQGNVEPTGLADLLKWVTNRDEGTWNAYTVEDKPYGNPPEKRVEKGITVTYVNHSTFLIQLDGLNILTDPVWSERVSPFSFAGPKRMRPPGIKFDNLPPIDLVLISHNHYDHLDLETLKRVVRHSDPEIVTPLGVNLYIEKNITTRTRSFDWWDTYQVNDSVTIHTVPAQHFSSRGMFDRDKTLWAGFVIQSPSGSVYFAGDSGYGSFFKEVGSRLGPFKLSMIPIGAYKPRWFMSPVHIDPAQAVQVHHDVRSELSIGMHYGTFPLADDGETEPINELKAALEEGEVRSDAFILLEEGKSIHVE
ncbi:MAG: MBL fold metallo-hydrolase [Bacteroidota bacterium]